MRKREIIRARKVGAPDQERTEKKMKAKEKAVQRDSQVSEDCCWGSLPLPGEAAADFPWGRLYIEPREPSSDVTLLRYNRVVTTGSINLFISLAAQVSFFAAKEFNGSRGMRFLHLGRYFFNLLNF